jgi:hypothetical protein
MWIRNTGTNVCIRFSIDFSYMDLESDSVETLTNVQFLKDFLVFQFLPLKCFCTALGTLCFETCDLFLVNSLNRTYTDRSWNK